MQNFGKIKNVFNNLLIEGVVKKDDASKKLFKKYVKTIKESEILKTQFLIYNNIENKVDSDSFSANIFVSENIKLLEKYDSSDILKENLKLHNLLKGTSIEKIVENPLNGLHESISSLIFTKRTPKNIEAITQEIKNVTNYIISNKPKEVNESIDLPVSLLTNLMVEKYNQKYSGLEKEDKEILRVLIEPNIENKKALYSKVVTECIGLVDNLLSEADTETREKLVKVKNRLNENNVEELNENDFFSKFSKLIELKDNLTK
jgi:hypothetical protein